MNLFDVMEDALLEASRIQREELARVGFTLEDLFPDEVADLRRFLGLHAPEEPSKPE